MRTELIESILPGYCTRPRYSCPNGLHIRRWPTDAGRPCVDRGEFGATREAYGLALHINCCVEELLASGGARFSGERPERSSDQNVDVVPVKARNSISPVYRDAFTPPKVNAPPGSSFVGLLVPRKRESQNPISGAEAWLPPMMACQKGVPVCESPAKANPIRPEIGLVSKLFVTVVPTTGARLNSPSAVKNRIYARNPVFDTEYDPMRTVSWQRVP